MVVQKLGLYFGSIIQYLLMSDSMEKLYFKLVNKVFVMMKISIICFYIFVFIMW